MDSSNIREVKDKSPHRSTSLIDDRQSGLSDNETVRYVCVNQRQHRWSSAADKVAPHINALTRLEQARRIWTFSSWTNLILDKNVSGNGSWPTQRTIVGSQRATDLLRGPLESNHEFIPASHSRPTGVVFTGRISQRSGKRTGFRL